MGIKQDEGEEDATDRAKRRYTKYRKEPDASLTGTEIRRRIHVRRMLESLSRARSSL